MKEGDGGEVADGQPQLSEKQEAVRYTDVTIPSPATHTPIERLDGGNHLDEILTAEAAIKIQKLFRVRIARKRLRELLAAVVEKHYDDDSGLYFYYNKRTGESSWEKPKTLKANEDLDVAGDARPNSRDAMGDGTEVVDLEEEQPEQDEEGDGGDEGEDEDEEGEEGEEEGGEDGEGDGEGDEDAEPEDATNPSGFSREEQAMIRRQFDQYDVDHSGSISAQELLQIMQNLGEPLTLKNVQEMIKQVNANSNGEVEFDEFLMILRKQKDKNQYSASIELAMLFGPKEVQNLKRQFMKLDVDGSGSIEENEIKMLIKKLGQRVEDFDLQGMIKEVDKDGGGSIGFNEFLQIVANMMQEKNAGKQSGFAKLLNMGIAQGLLNDLDDVMKKSRAAFNEWWNADAIAEQKRLAAKRERRRKAEEERRRKQEQDEAIFREHQAKLVAIEAARRAPIEGLVHEIEFAGDGVNYPMVGQYARVHYVGMFEKTGEVFESTRKRGGALEFCVGVGHLIKGFDLVLQRMSVGETSRITMAPMLAYGVKGRPPKIPPNATLVFKIELISIKEKVGFAPDFALDD